MSAFDPKRQPQIPAVRPGVVVELPVAFDVEIVRSVPGTAHKPIFAAADSDQSGASLVEIKTMSRNQAALNATISTTSLPIPLTKTIALEQSDIAFGDLVPQFSVRWNAGVNNYMVYITGDILVGKYDSQDLANLGIGHGALDGGVGYTYFDEKTGHEFSAVAGLTGNFENNSTGYTNGLDFHLDWGASQFLSKQVQVGLVGYFYDQLTPDRGCAPQLCPFESRVIGIGPQLGYLFSVGNMQG